MSRIKDSARITTDYTVLANGTGIINTPPVQPGQVLVIQSLAFRNATGARGTATIRLNHGGVITELGDQESPDANTWYYYPFEQHIIEGEQVEVAQASCVAADVLSLRVIGYIEYFADIEVD